MPKNRSHHEGTPIVFAFYKDNKLYGYRQNTLGFISLKDPKIYHFSRDQVDKILHLIESEMKDDVNRPLIEMVDFGSRRAGAIASNKLRNSRKILTTFRHAFEVRVLESPEYHYIEEEIEHINHVLRWPYYPQEAVDEWLRRPKEHVAIETHFFTPKGVIHLQ